MPESRLPDDSVSDFRKCMVWFGMAASGLLMQPKGSLQFISQPVNWDPMPSPSASAPPVSCVVLYVKDIPKVAAFYERCFGMTPLPGATKGWMQLASPSGGCVIALHQAAVTQRSGAAMKLVFGVADVRAFKSAKEKQG